MVSICLNNYEQQIFTMEIWHWLMSGVLYRTDLDPTWAYANWTQACPCSPVIISLHASIGASSFLLLIIKSRYLLRQIGDCLPASCQSRKLTSASLHWPQCYRQSAASFSFMIRETSCHQLVIPPTLVYIQLGPKVWEHIKNRGALNGNLELSETLRT